MKLSTKQIVTAGALLALMIISQFLKNTSVFITGPIVNTILLIATLCLGLGVGIILSVIAPITSFIITGSPIIAGIPLIMPVIMIGNIILCYFAYAFEKTGTLKIKATVKTTDTKKFCLNKKIGLPVGLVIGSILKFLFMWAVIVLILLPSLSGNIKVPSEKLPVILKTARFTFSTVQLVTSLIGSAIAFAIYRIAGKYLKNM